MKVGIYCRVSTEKQIDNTSLTNQKLRGIEFCERNGYDYELFSEQISGGVVLEDRKMFDKLSNNLLSGELDAIWLLSWDRGWRDDLIKHYFIRLVESSRCKVFVDGIEKDVLSGEGKLELGFFSLMNDFERNKIVSRLRGGKRSRWRQGKGLSGKVPIGYQKSEDGVWEVNEEESKVVKDVFKFFLYKSVTSVNEVYERIVKKYGREVNGKKLTYHIVQSILQSEYYCGLYTIRDKEIDEVFEFNIGSIVDDLTIERVKDKRRVNRSFKKTNEKKRLLLKGLVYCEDCNQLMWLQSQKQNGKDYSSYVCQYVKRKYLKEYNGIGKDEFKVCSCYSSNRVNVKKLDYVVWNSLMDFLKDSDTLKRVYRKKYEEGRSGKDALLGKMKYYKSLIDEWKAKRLTMISDWLGIEGGKELFVEWEKEKYNVKVGEFEQRIYELSNDLSNYEESVDDVEDYIDLMKSDIESLQYCDDFNTKRAKIVEYVKEVRVKRLDKDDFSISIRLYSGKGDLDDGKKGSFMTNVLGSFSVEVQQIVVHLTLFVPSFFDKTLCRIWVYKI
jgi:site-specific DNA recombinase